MGIDRVKYPLLSQINGPSDTKRLKASERKALAGELRTYMLEVVSENGGHLSSSLGVVELTIALHCVFDFPQDKLIWDVGHQCYAHKLLSGRAEAFSELRRLGGISGFPKRSESEYDCFDTGHASTSISAALGMAVAQELDDSHHEVIAVIGDGSLTGGLAFEGLNNAGDIKKKLIVILNDNDKAIADNVGALSKHLARIRTAPSYGRTKKGIKKFLSQVPLIGNPLIAFLDAVKRMLKSVLLKDYFFEELGFVYLGPFDGHNINGLISALENARQYDGPVLVHIITEKGRGYRPAELDPNRFHGVAPFNQQDGSSKKPVYLTYTDVFGNALHNLGKENEDIIAITAAMPDGTGLNSFASAYPQRFFDVGIAEEHAVTFAAGLAAAGKRPVCAIYSTFLQRAYDQILHDVAEPQLPVVFAIDRAGIVGEDGETHQGVFDIAFLRTIPNLLIMAPKDSNELQAMLPAAVSCNCPVAIRYPKGAAYRIDEVIASEIPINSWELLREGESLCIIACGSMVQAAMQAAGSLHSRGIEAMVISARFLNCVDEALLARAGKRILTVEEGIEQGGLYSLVAENAAREVELLHIALPMHFIPQGSRCELLRKFDLTADGIIKHLSEAGWINE